MELTKRDIKFIIIGESILLLLLTLSVVANIVLALLFIDNFGYEPTDVDRNGVSDLTDLSVLSYQLHLNDGGLVEQLCQ